MNLGNTLINVKQNILAIRLEAVIYSIVNDTELTMGEINKLQEMYNHYNINITQKILYKIKPYICGYESFNNELEELDNKENEYIEFLKYLDSYGVDINYTKQNLCFSSYLNFLIINNRLSISEALVIAQSQINLIDGEIAKAMKRKIKSERYCTDCLKQFKAHYSEFINHYE